MKTILVAGDVAPCQAFERLAATLVKDGNGVASCFKNSSLGTHSTLEAILSDGTDTLADNILIGLSSSREKAEEEIAAAELALSKGIPLGIYADTFNVYGRKLFQHIIPKAKFLFVITDEERRKAEALFPDVEVVVSGNPIWEDYFTREVSREEVRKRLDVGDDEFLICVPLAKHVEVNMHLITAAQEGAGQGIAAADKVKVVVCIHPGEDRGGLLGRTHFYKTYADASDTPTHVAAATEITTSHVLDGSDLVVDYISSAGVEAAHLRLPVINYFSSYSLDRLEELTGSRSWPLCEQGCSIAINGDVKELSRLIGEFHRGEAEDSASMRAAQVKAFPRVEKESGRAVAQMKQSLHSNTW